MCSAGQRIRLSNEWGDVLSWEAESAHEGSAQLLEVLLCRGWAANINRLIKSRCHIFSDSNTSMHANRPSCPANEGCDKRPTNAEELLWRSQSSRKAVRRCREYENRARTVWHLHKPWLGKVVRLKRLSVALSSYFQLHCQPLPGFASALRSFSRI